MRELSRLWSNLTAVQGKEADLAQREYFTKAILVIMGVLFSFATLAILAGWGVDFFPLSSLVIILLLDLPVVLAFWWVSRGWVALAGCVPPGLCIGLAFYITYNSTLISTGQLITMIAILLVAMLQGLRLQWLVALLSAVGYLAIGIFHFHTPAPQLVAFGIMISCAFAGAALLIGFYIDQLKTAYARERSSQEQIRYLFERVPVGLYRTSPEGCILDANPGMVDMLGYPDRETLLGKTSGSLYVDPNLRDQENALLEKTGTVHDFQLQLRRLDGKTIWVRDTVRVTRDEAGKVLYYEGSLEDVTGRVRAEQEQRINEARYRAIVEDQTELICRFLPDGRLTFVNEAYCRYFGQPREQLLGQSFAPLVYKKDHPRLVISLAKVSPDDPAVCIEHQMKDAAGNSRWQQWSNRAIYGPSNDLVEFQAIGRDITEQKLAEERLSYLATHDPLTDVPNRILLQESLNTALRRAHRRREEGREDHKLAVMMLDMDDFKQINDLYGHSTGDQVLQATAQRMRDCLRAGDTLARMGGDEFILVIGELRSPADGALVAQKLIQVISEPYVLDGRCLALSASVGISMYPQDGEEIESLLKYADSAMYRAKEARGCYRFYT